MIDRGYDWYVPGDALSGPGERTPFHPRPARAADRPAGHHPIRTMTAIFQAQCRALAQYDLGPVLRTTVRAIGCAVAVVYVAGLALGWAIHWLNDWLAGKAMQRPSVPQPATIRNLQIVAPPAPTPSTPPSLTVAQLRRMARAQGHHGNRIRDARRAELLELLAV